MRRIALLTLTFAAIAAPAAHAGGWASAELSSTPASVGPGEPWVVDITVLQHGMTPMVGITPAVVVTDASGKELRFAGKPTAKTGVYRAEVTFPSAGRYDYSVDDGFTNAVPHEFPPVVIEESAAASTGGIAWWPFAGVAALVGLAGLMAALVHRRRSAAPAPV